MPTPSRTAAIRVLPVCLRLLGLSRKYTPEIKSCASPQITRKTSDHAQNHRSRAKPQTTRETSDHGRVLRSRAHFQTPRKPRDDAQIASVQQFTPRAPISSLHSVAYSALGADDGMIHGSASLEVMCF